LTVADIRAGLIGDVGAPITANDASHPAAKLADHLAAVLPGRIILFYPRLRVVSLDSWMLRVLGLRLHFLTGTIGSRPVPPTFTALISAMYVVMLNSSILHRSSRPVSGRGDRR
jgi:hypothetical protein